VQHADHPQHNAQQDQHIRDHPASPARNCRLLVNRGSGQGST
jgi:hypothetical protein